MANERLLSCIQTTNLNDLITKETINAFIEGKEIAIAGASPKKGNWGLTLMKELKSKGYKVYPVNPKFAEIEDFQCYESVKELPVTVENLILAVNPQRAIEIIGHCSESGIKRVWLNQGIGDGAYSDSAVQLLKEKKMEYVYGFCPMMFFGKGLHKFHFWMRKNLGKVPAEYSKN
jgi:predicted CoA-binding protein